MLFLSLSLSGCADYQHFTDVNIKWNETEVERMAIESKITMEAAGLILHGFTQESRKETSPLFTRTFTDPHGNKTTETIYDSSSHLVDFLIAQQQAHTLEIILPILHEIFKRQQLEMEAPVTVGAVALAFIEQIPIMTTIGGMYSLGAVGIKNAGAYISKTIATNTTTNTTSTNTPSTNRE